MANEAVDKRFEMIKKRLVGQAQVSKQQNDEQLQRQLVSGIGLSSGAGLKLQAQSNEQGQRQIQDIGEAVEGQKLDTQIQQEETQKNRDFATSERLGSQDFSSGERRSSQRFSKGERLGSQNFAKGERVAGQGFSQRLFDREMTFKRDQSELQNSQFLQGLEQNSSQFDRQLDLDGRISDFNMKMAKDEAGQTPLDKYSVGYRLGKKIGIKF